ncbi:MAG TPA: folylpolyglutamate synthase/dihydrofolate synthase family protein [Candidatus Omnitrophota bacterium]|nr:bifunctional folylpolyglutamate synthase/dihydrofolate synthase [Candidatus Omnitrophota bacterium]HPB67441.1 folylpolyglutamate synthase/dihydrofolate synthase family protein [Candidatus Omnitrophota bacterium]HQO58241.1 folylpolyglutamate synthase/dihydrofolate synthase family protein [Candidatus Omnitrophota bacterium]HQP11262.1 folylpolyglutamate synthase/dihydrofolate synthase family protein [Candidatus Omnitrophota bacterium]
MTPQDVRIYLDSFLNLEKLAPTAFSSEVFKLKRVEHVLGLLGDPHKDMVFVHVAGTKGKGSTCAYAAYILREAGYTAGLYTSPHWWDVKERIRILSPGSGTGQPELFEGCIREEEFCGIFERMRPVLEPVRKEGALGRLTYFEVLTLAALLYFKIKRVDCVVLETGMGGRLDATNVVDSAVCGLTPVSMDHTQILGASLASIAREKAGIIKTAGQNVVVANQPPAAEAVIRQRIKDIGCKAFFSGKDFGVLEADKRGDRQDFGVRGRRADYTVTTGLMGTHQRENAALAVGMIECLTETSRLKIPAQAVQKGIAATLWPGRFQIVRSDPIVVLDVAHNSDSARALAETVRECFPGKQVILVLGISRDKDLHGICRHLASVAREVIITKAGHPRAADLDDLKIRDIFRGQPFTVSRHVQEGVAMALTRAGKDDVIVVAGSVFVAAEAGKEFFPSFAGKSADKVS